MAELATHKPHRLEALAGVALEACQLVYDEHVKRHAGVVVLDQPHPGVAAKHVEVGILLQSLHALLLCAYDAAHAQTRQMLPFLHLV